MEEIQTMYGVAYRFTPAELASMANTDVTSSAYNNWSRTLSKSECVVDSDFLEKLELAREMALEEKAFKPTRSDLALQAFCKHQKRVIANENDYLAETNPIDLVLAQLNKAFKAKGSTFAKSRYFVKFLLRIPFRNLRVDLSPLGLLKKDKTPMVEYHMVTFSKDAYQTMYRGITNLSMKDRNKAYKKYLLAENSVTGGFFPEATWKPAEVETENYIRKIASKLSGVEIAHLVAFIENNKFKIPTKMQTKKDEVSYKKNFIKQVVDKYLSVCIGGDLDKKGLNKAFHKWCPDGISTYQDPVALIVERYFQDEEGHPVTTVRVETKGLQPKRAKTLKGVSKFSDYREK